MQNRKEPGFIISLWSFARFKASSHFAAAQRTPTYANNPPESGICSPVGRTSSYACYPCARPFRCLAEHIGGYGRRPEQQHLHAAESITSTGIKR